MNDLIDRTSMLLPGTLCHAHDGPGPVGCRARATARVDGVAVCDDHAHLAVCGTSATRTDGALRVCVVCDQPRGWA